MAPKRKATESARSSTLEPHKRQKLLDFHDSTGDLSALGSDIVLHITYFLRGSKEALINLRNCNRYFHSLVMTHHLVLIWRVSEPKPVTIQQTISQMYDPELLYGLEIETSSGRFTLATFLHKLPQSLKMLRLKHGEQDGYSIKKFRSCFPSDLEIFGKQIFLDDVITFKHLPRTLKCLDIVIRWVNCSFSHLSQLEAVTVHFRDSSPKLVNWPTSLTYLSISFGAFMTSNVGHHLKDYIGKLTNLKTIGLFGKDQFEKEDSVIALILKGLPESVTTLGTDYSKYFWRFIPQNVTTLCICKGGYHYFRAFQWSLLPSHISTVHIENYEKDYELRKNAPPHVSISCWTGSFFEYHYNPYGKRIHGSNAPKLL